MDLQVQLLKVEIQSPGLDIDLKQKVWSLKRAIKFLKPDLNTDLQEVSIRELSHNPTKSRHPELFHPTAAATSQTYF